MMKKKMKTLLMSLMMVFALAGAVSLYGCSNSQAGDAETAANKQEQTEDKTTADDAAQVNEEAEKENRSIPGGTQYEAVINVKDYGTITFTMDEGIAPETVKNFVSLAQSGFYDGLTFHRIMEGFMIQGGDPMGNGTGGSSRSIKGEFESNGFDNTLDHVRGTVSMARSSLPDSASSQFFIVQEDSDFLDGDYAAFGTVTDGMDVVDAIAAAAQPTDSNGTIEKDQQPVIESITVTEIE